jgi:hypothetical protein
MDESMKDESQEIAKVIVAYDDGRAYSILGAQRFHIHRCKAELSFRVYSSFAQ